MNDHVQALVGRAQAGDLAAASELLGEFYERIFAYFRRLSGDNDEAADLTQQTFCKVWRALSGFNRRASFNTWLHAIAHHVYVDWRRRKNPLEIQSDDWWETCAAEGPGPFENASDREAAHQLYRLIDALEDEQREVLHLHYYQALSIQETAEALGIATSTVKYRLRNGIELLKSRMAGPKLRT